MTHQERRAVGRAVTRVWRATATVADRDPQPARCDLEEALRELVGLLPDGDAVVTTLAEGAGPAGAELARAIRRQEEHDEPARQYRLALDDAR